MDMEEVAAAVVVADADAIKMNIVFIFPGQGSQKTNMGRDFYENFKSSRQLLEDASDFCKIDFKNLLFKANEDLNKSQFTQVSILLNSLMAYNALMQLKSDIRPKFSLGHSLGEFSALAISGAFDFLEALMLVYKRGLFMQEDCLQIQAGMMVVLGLEDERVEELCRKAMNEGKRIFPANYNCDGQIVLAGLKADLMSYEGEFKSAGASKTMFLNMSVASHCPLLEHASNKLFIELQRVLKDDFQAVISNVNAKTYTSKKEALKLLKAQLVSPVLYKQSIGACEKETDFFIEFGASVLKGLNKKITSKPTYSLSTSRDIEDFLRIL